LNIKIKSYEEIKKEIENRKRKGRNERKYEKGLGEPFRPRTRSQPTAQNCPISNRYLLSPLFLADKWAQVA
jgi:hypothetical protein